MKKSRMFGKVVGIFVFTIMAIFGCSKCSATISSNLPKSEMRYDQNDNSSVFPDSYKQYIRDLKARHPSWTFKAVYTNVNWDQLMQHETYDVNDGISTVPDSYPSAWKRDGKNYYKDGNFVTASKSAVAYSMDPRNFLNENGIFQFEALSYSQSSANRTTISKVLASTVMGQEAYKNKYKNNNQMLDLPDGLTYLDIICNAGQQYNVSPVHIASRLKQETGGNILNNASINGSCPGYEGLYNFFNVRATPNADGTGSIANGLAYARTQGWVNPKLSIYGGVDFLRQKYIQYGQDTIYFQKFDVNNPYNNASSLFGHQYMTNILAPSNEAKISYSSYNKAGMLGESYEFHIPVYDNIPPSNCPYPGEEAKLNIDEATTNKTTLFLRGWLMSYDANSKLEVYIDGNRIDSNISRVDRPDVLAAIQGYGGSATNPKPGYETHLDLTKITNGNHTLEVRAVTSTGSVQTVATRSITVNKYDIFTSIDSPENNEGTTAKMLLKGWIMTECSNVSVNVKIDHQLVLNNIPRTDRPDVLASVQGYGGSATNPKPGYEIYFDGSQLDYGNHLYQIEVVDNNTGEVLQSVYRNVVTNRYEVFTSIDVPDSNITSFVGTEFKGWIMSNDPTKQVQFLIDAIDITDKITRTKRPDVIAAVQGYGDETLNPNPGFESVLPKELFGPGSHKLTVKVTLTNGKVLETYRMIEKQEAPSLLAIEEPQENKEFLNHLYIQGWSLVNKSNITLRVWLDNQDITSLIQRNERPDVLEVFNGVEYKGEENIKSGYLANLDISQLAVGNHVLKVEQLENGNVINDMSRSFKVKQTSAIPSIDTPSENAMLENQFKIVGWLMSDNELSQWKIYLDNEDITSTVTRTKRDDVIAAVKGYGDATQNPNPGFECTVDASKYFAGTHKIRIENVLPNGNIITSIERKIQFKRGTMFLSLDNPNQDTSAKNTLSIRGWYMSSYQSTYFGVYIDEVDVTNQMTRTKREDVLNAVKGYGDATQNPNPGFDGQIDISNLAPGKHTLRVASWFHTGEQVNTIYKTIYVLPDVSFISIDAPSDKSNIQGNQMYVQGWGMCNNKKATLSVYLDNIDITKQIERVKRPDVIANVKGYGDEETNPNPGFKGTIDISTVSKGQHRLKAVYKVDGKELTNREYTINIQ